MSSTKTITRKRKRHTAAKVLVSLLLIGMVAGYLVLLTSAHNHYTIIDGDTVTAFRSSDTAIDQVLAQAGVAVGPEDRVTATGNGSSTEILIQRRSSVTVDLAGDPIQADTYESTVEALLAELDISLNEEDSMVSQGKPLSPQERLYDGMKIEITQNDTQTVTKTTAIPYETLTYRDPTLPEGKESVRTPGVEGQRETVYLQKYINGELVESSVLSTRLLSPPVTEVVLVGSSTTSSEADHTLSASQDTQVATPEPEAEAEPEASPAAEPEPEPEPEPEAPASTGPDYEPFYEEPVYEAPAYEEPVYEEPSYVEPAYEETVYQEPVYEAPVSYGNTLITAGGDVISYSEVLYMEATAYTGGGTTATGTPARYGAIAVDPRVISYGTRMYIVTDDGEWVYGYATAEDCGGAVKGNIIDLYFDDYNTCIQFGRRNCTVYILD